MRCGLEHRNRHLYWSLLYFHDSVEPGYFWLYFSIVFFSSRTFLNRLRRGYGVTVRISDQSTVQFVSQAEIDSASRERRRLPHGPMVMQQRPRSTDTVSVGTR